MLIESIQLVNIQRHGDMSHHRVKIKHRQTQFLTHARGEGRKIGAFKDYGADVGMLLQALAQDAHYLVSNSVQIKGTVRITVHTTPLGLLVHAVNKHIFAVGDICTGKVLLSQVVSIGGQNSNLAVFAHDGLSERHLQQGAGENHLGHCGSQSLLIKCIEAAAGGDSLYTLSGQLLTYSDIPVTKMMGYTGTEQPMGSILCVWCDGPSVGYTTGYGYREKNQTNQQSVYNLIKAMAEYNPDYFTGKVKLSASDDATGVSVAVTGAKGQKATVEVKKITSDFIFDTEAHVSYNVTPAVDGKAYTGEGTVTLPVPEGWATEASRIRAYIIDNGAVKLISGTLSGGKYTFQVPHFSEMGLVQLAEGAPSKTENITLTVGGTKTVSVDGMHHKG